MDEMCSTTQEESLGELCMTRGKKSSRARSRHHIIDPLADNFSELPTRIGSLPALTYENIGEYIGDENTAAGIEKTMKFLARYRLISNTRLCPECSKAAMSLNKDAGRCDRFMWRCRSCRTSNKNEGWGGSHRLSIRDGSFFKKAHLSLAKSLKIMAYWASFPTAPLSTATTRLTVSKEMMLDWLNFIRDETQACFERTSSDSSFGGEGVIVEIDESVLYGEKYSRKRLWNRASQWVFTVFDRGSNKVGMLKIDNRDSDTLFDLIQKHIRQGTIVIIDNLSTYGTLDEIREGFAQKWANHPVNFVNPMDPLVFPSEGTDVTFDALKRDLKNLYGTTPDLTSTYIYQYLFRRHYGSKILNRLLENVAISYPL